MHHSRAQIALLRHALAAEEAKLAKRVSPLRAKAVSRAVAPPVVSDEAREEYEYELAEQAGRYMDAGYGQDEADRRALDDLGCVEFWEYRREGTLAAQESREAGGLPAWAAEVNRKYHARLRAVEYPGIRAMLESWAEQGPREVLTSSGKHAPVTHGPLDRSLVCPRCESVGHSVEACPFDARVAEVKRVAEARRMRRRERAA